ncbi:hypothetical protein J4E83_007546 [Alternaria metachromatica]|uniref:uncharacterized protein n=1 Tax=Alternaria metachromatica TaxID=283354 RepID=UPI0020C3A62F|nr:uncharacterized protein J4E83_007546 [Alternaria metachromatica]KAI4613135.1 hypothetical protein J4E83_007546 [Alternaria metachromatica]
MTGANKSKIPSIRPASFGVRSPLPERALSPATRATTTPTGTSRLPRRPQSEKPLPSPPVAQVVDPNSPPKASRTLVDAFTPSPTLENWPILAPENIPPRLSSKRSSLPTRSGINSGRQTPSNGKEGNRVKRLSWHSTASGSSSGTGPILTISADADAVILGQRDSIPAVPTIPAVLPERTSQPRSLGALASRLTRATTSKASLSIATTSPVHSTAELTANGSPVVKISPIRSMQPARKPSLDAHSPQLPLSPSMIFPDATTVGNTPEVIVETERSVSPISDRSATPTPEPRSVPLLRDSSEPPVDSWDAYQEQLEELSEPTIVPGPDDSLTVSKVRRTAPARENASPSPSSIYPTVEDDSTANPSAAELSSSSLPHAEPSRETVRTQAPPKPRTAETARSISIDNPLGRGIPKARQPFRRHVTPVVSSSPAEDTPPDNHDKETVTSRIKAKRSIRNLFNREKTSPKSPEAAASKQGFMSSTRSSLAKVLRDSKSLSKVHLPRKTEPKLETESDHVSNKRSFQPGMFSTFPSGRATPAEQPSPGRPSHADEMLHDIVDRIDAQPENSQERLRHVEIAEVSEALRINTADEALRLKTIAEEELVLTVRNKQCIISAADSSRKANISAMEARKSAVEAEFHADRVTSEFTRLRELLDSTPMDAESTRYIKSFLPKFERKRSREEIRRGFMPGFHTAC